MDVGCAEKFTCYVTDYGEVYMTDKGDFEHTTMDDPELYELPYPVLLELEIRKIFCSPLHFVALDVKGKSYVMGDGEFGSLGLGDTKNRLKVCMVEDLEDYNVVDVSLGVNFTVWICEKRVLTE